METVITDISGSQRLGVEAWGLEEGRDEQAEPGDFQDSETILYDTVMTDAGHYTFLETHRMYNTKSES